MYTREGRINRPMGRHGQKGREASIHAALDDFVTKLKRKRLGGSSLALARHSTEVLIHAVAAQQAAAAEPTCVREHSTRPTMQALGGMLGMLLQSKDREGGGGVYCMVAL